MVTTVGLLVMPTATAVMFAVPAVFAGVQTTGALNESHVPAHTSPLWETVATAVLSLEKLVVGALRMLPLESVTLTEMLETWPKSSERVAGVKVTVEATPTELFPPPHPEMVRMIARGASQRRRRD